FFFFSSRRRHTRFDCDWSSDVCSSDLLSSDVDTGKNNVELLPGDTVAISKAGIVYVVGEVNRPGGFVIEDNAITASQVLALAARSEERRVGKECRSRMCADHERKNEKS